MNSIFAGFRFSTVPGTRDRRTGVCWRAAVSVLLLLPITQSVLSADERIPKSVHAFLQSHCADCHADGAEEGGFTFDELSASNTDIPALDDEAAFARWERVFDQVESGAMPPADAEALPSQQRKQFLQSLRTPLQDAHRSRRGTVLRRLNRREYQNTLNDLFGTHLDLESLLPKDGRTHEFDNVGASLNISMVQLQAYLQAIDLVLETSIANTTQAPEPTLISTSYADTREAKTHLGKAWKKLDDGAVVFYRTIGYPTGMLRTANTRKAGFYRIKVTGYAHQATDPITFSIGATTFARGAERPIFSYHSMPPGDPTSVEITAWMDDRYMVAIEPVDLHDTEYLIKKNGIDAYPGPGLAILNVELEGPLLDQWPSRGHDLLFEGIARREIEPSNPATKKKSWYQPQFELSLSNDDSEIQAGIERICRAAFRRPVSDADVLPFLKLFQSERQSGASAEDAYRTAVAAIFCSPDFLFLKESEGRLSDHELANRLAYFLTRTQPDPELRTEAETGRLADDARRIADEAERLMKSEHFDRFVVDFTDAWLNLRDIEFTSPDRNLYPEFDPFLQHSMLQETRQYFRHLIEHNRPVREVVSSDYAMLNSRLARHYEIDGVSQPQVQKTPLPADSVRGGVLSMGSVLKVSANGTNTSPVVRGVWVLERILGTTPPPPPPGVPGVEPDIRGASTLRELLDKHRDVDSCRTCHQMIDPPGFALESFNPIGGWRDRFRSLGEGDRVKQVVAGRKVRYKLGPPVDASGQLNDGQEFTGFQQFRSLLLQDEDQIAEAMLEKLLVFATGREMGFSDRPEIEALVEESRHTGHRMRDMMKLVVGSHLFRSK